MARTILQWRDKKPMAAGVKLTHVICSLTVVKCYFVDSFGRMSFEQKFCLNYGAATMLGSKSYSIYLKNGDSLLYHESRVFKREQIVPVFSMEQMTHLQLRKFL